MRIDFDNQKMRFPNEDKMRIDFDNQKKRGFQMRIK
jgi:hypothetical protein